MNEPISMRLSLLGVPGAAGEPLVVLGSCGDDLACEVVPDQGAELTWLEAERDRIERTIASRERRRVLAVELECYGERLFAFAFPGRVGALLRRLLDRPVRVHLHTNGPRLQRLPWEFARLAGLLHAPSERCVIVRAVETPPGSRELADGPSPDPLRVLYFSAEPLGAGPVNWVQVRESIRKEWLRLTGLNVDFHIVDGTSRRALVRAVTDSASPFDVIHYCGHADIDASGNGFLALVDDFDPEGVDEYPSQALCALLQDRRPRLVVLSACRTSAGDFSRPFAVIATALLHVGVPAVVANQMYFPEATAATFAASLYRQLLAEGDIDLAVAAGRQALFQQLHLGRPTAGGTSAALDWGIPTLYRRYSAGRLFPPARTLPAARSAAAAFPENTVLLGAEDPTLPSKVDELPAWLTKGVTQPTTVGVWDVGSRVGLLAPVLKALNYEQSRYHVLEVMSPTPATVLGGLGSGDESARDEFLWWAEKVRAESGADYLIALTEAGVESPPLRDDRRVDVVSTRGLRELDGAPGRPFEALVGWLVVSRFLALDAKLSPTGPATTFGELQAAVTDPARLDPLSPGRRQAAGRLAAALNSYRNGGPT